MEHRLAWLLSLNSQQVYLKIIHHAWLDLLLSIKYWPIQSRLHYYPFMVILDRCNGSCNCLKDPSGKKCFPNKTEGECDNVIDNNNK